jgi:hypothetical protein
VLADEKLTAFRELDRGDSQFQERQFAESHTNLGQREEEQQQSRKSQTASEAILSLRPVTFHHKTDNNETPQFGLIAEEVAKVNPALVLPDKEGKPYTVRYNAANAMLLNELLKEHRKTEKLEATVAQQQK